MSNKKQKVTKKVVILKNGFNHIVVIDTIPNFEELGNMKLEYSSDEEFKPTMKKKII